MVHTTNFVIIDGNNKVINKIWGAVHQITPTEIIIQIDDLAVDTGDDYNPDDGKIYRNGEVVQSLRETVQQRDAVLDEFQEALELGSREDTFTASKNYSTGELIIIKGEAYKTVKGIPIDKKMILGQDIIPTTIKDYMEENQNG